MLLTALITACFFLAGIFDLLNNYMVIILILLGFLSLIVNLILALKNKKNPE